MIKEGRISSKRLRYRQNFMETILICDSNIQLIKLIKIHASNSTLLWSLHEPQLKLVNKFGNLNSIKL